MAKFPIDDANDKQGIVDAINYALSGPAGLGQNFSGYSAYEPVYIRPTTRQPFTLPIDTTLDPSWYLDVPITTITTVGSNPTQLLAVTFATPFTDAPFQSGDRITLANTVAAGADPDFYNGYTYTILNCSTTGCEMYLNRQLTWPGLASPGGDLIRDYYDYDVSTDANGRVGVQSGTDRVFINAQLLFDFDYTCSTDSDWTVSVRINRYVGYPNTEVGSTDYYFTNGETISERILTYNEAASGTKSDQEVIFTSVLDANIEFGYYWYILEVSFNTGSTGDALPGKFIAKLRSLTAQVVKE